MQSPMIISHMLKKKTILAVFDFSAHVATVGDFTFWISLSLTPNFGLSERPIQKVKSPSD